jgi:hypothetical protein
MVQTCGHSDLSQKEVCDHKQNINLWLSIQQKLVLVCKNMRKHNFTVLKLLKLQDGCVFSELAEWSRNTMFIECVYFFFR